MINEREGREILAVLEEYDIYQIEHCKTRRFAYANPFDPTRTGFNDGVNITTSPIDDYQVTVSEQGLGNLARDVQDYRDMRQFMRQNPQFRHEFEKWHLLELLKR
jgi:hypothetical protein